MDIDIYCDRDRGYSYFNDYSSKSENESKRILEQIKEEHSRNIENKGNMRVSNSGNNSGILIGNNSGDIHK